MAVLDWKQCERLERALAAMIYDRRRKWRGESVNP